MKKDMSGKQELSSITLPAFPTLVNSAYRYFDQDGCLWVGYANNWLRLSSSSSRISEVLDLLDGSRPLESVLEEAQGLIRGIRREQVARLLEALFNHGLLMAGRPQLKATLEPHSDYYRRHSRDLEFYALFEQENVSRYDYLSNLMNAKIVVLGLGGVGSWSTLALACLGVGCLVGVDFDLVELSNLSRQILFTPDDIGKPKTDVTQVFLAEFSSGLKFVPQKVRVSGPEDLQPLMEGADFLILAADWPFRSIARWVNQVCWTMNIPSIYMSASLSRIVIGPMVIPNRTSCRECFYSQQEFPNQIEKLAKDAWVTDPMPAIAPIPGLAGNMLAWEVLCYLTGIQTPQSLGRALELDLRTLDVKVFDVPTNPACPVCQPLTNRGSGLLTSVL